MLGALIVFAPLVFNLIERWADIRMPFGIGILRYLLAAAVLSGSFYGMHRGLPWRPMRRFRLGPGIRASVAIRAVVATGLSICLACSPSCAVTCGALAGVIVTLLFFYLTGVALIFGARVNATVNADGNAERPGAARGPDAERPPSG